MICHPNGARDIALYDRDDPTEVRAAAALSPLEAHHLANLLAATSVIGLVSDGDVDVDAVTVARVPIPAGSDYDGRPLGSLGAAAVVVAVLRDGHPIVKPDTRQALRYGDTLVVVGTRDTIDHLGRVVTGGLTTRNG